MRHLAIVLRASSRRCSNALGNSPRAPRSSTSMCLAPRSQITRIIAQTYWMVRTAFIRVVAVSVPVSFSAFHFFAAVVMPSSSRPPPLPLPPPPPGDLSDARLAILLTAQV